MTTPQRQRIFVEVSIEDAEFARYAYENFEGESDSYRDPFDILAQLEEELGEPIYRS